MGEDNENAANTAAAPTSKREGALTVEKIYQKKSQLEHILLRPDTYIGSVEPVTEQMWVFDSESDSMVQREISFVPGLYKIFDEILVNAADNKQRDPTMNCIKITINPEENIISIWNNGEGIPVVLHKDEKMYVPTMIFGHLLTSSNYNDEEEKVTGGRNGYGAKLCNIFSTKFTVETSSKKYKKAFKQTWRNNMGKAEEVKVKESLEQDYTKVTFSPDLSKFKMDKLDKDIVDLMSRRAYDVAASTRGVRVFLNGNKLPIKNFKDYVDLYIKGKEDDAGNPLKVAYESVNDRWEVAVTISEKGFQQVSFVNSIATTKGGRHVDYVADALTKQLIESIKKKNKGGMTIKPFQVKTHMWIFINCLIVNPTFDSQTKEHMTLQTKNFGSKCNLSEKFMTQVSKGGLIEQVLTWAKFKAQTILERAAGGKKKSKLRGIPKLDDANDAGSKHSLSCTLILTEGDSAKALAVSGLSVVGRDKFGVFPLRGKLLNVREATHKQILENAEINNIIKIMGLQYKKKYETKEDMETLRYGKIMIMTDQDQDGSHIKGLIVNFIHYNWPSLIKMPFLEVFITPIIKATNRNEEIAFYSLPEFDQWREETTNVTNYKIKYYKGLGTSTSKEAREYFSNMDRHRIKFKYSGPECDQHIVMAFSKKCVEQRKEWLTNWMTERKRRKDLGLPEEYLYMKDTKTITYKDFINKELVLFSNMDNERSIPSVVDGLKPGSRKVLYTCFKRNDKREVKVAQLAGSVAEHSAYHHGEQSLMATIINLAQNYVGTNNINLLQPIGQFGTRLQAGKDAASPRYIFTMLSPLARLIFHPHDDPLLKYQKDDNQRIEPVWYCPIIPMVLVNGADGIGTGWMTKIPNYNPREIMENLKCMINSSEPVISLKPWYKNFKGDIEHLIDGKYVISGEVGIINDEKIEITELPVSVSTHAYKETVLEPMLAGTEKQPALISDFKEYHSDTTVRFVISLSSDKLYNAERDGLHKVFKLQTTVGLSSMCAFDRHCCLRKYEAVNEIMKEFYDLRLEYYGKRKEYLEGVLEAEAAKLSDQARFIIEKCSGELVVENKKKVKLIEELQKRGYRSDPVKEWKEQLVKKGEMDDEDTQKPSEDSTTEEEAPAAPGAPNFDYLLSMTMWSLTLERKEELINKKNNKLDELHAMKTKTPGDIWLEDLENLRKKLDEVEEKERQEEMANLAGQTLPAKGRGAKGGGALGRKKAAIAVEILPSPVARRVVPEIGEEMKKKAETAVRLKEKKLKGPTKKEKKEACDAGGDKDKFDLIEEGVNKPKRGKREPKQPKSTTNSGPGSASKKGSKKKKKNPWESSEESDDFNSDDSMPATASQELIPERRVARRSAAANIIYKVDSDDEGTDDSFRSIRSAKNGRRSEFNSSEDEAKVEPPPLTTESPPVVTDTTSSTSTNKPVGKGKRGGDDVKKSKAKRTKKLASDVDSNSDDDMFSSPPKKKKTVKKRKRFGDSDSDDGDDDDFSF